MKQGCYSQRRHALLIDFRNTSIYTLFMHKQPQFPQFFSVFSRTVCSILVNFSVQKETKKGKSHGQCGRLGMHLFSQKPG